MSRIATHVSLDHPISRTAVLARGIAMAVACVWLFSCARAPENTQSNNDSSARSTLAPADSALNTALERDDIAAARRALQSGANPNANLFVGTVLAKAVISNDPALVELVLKAGADPNLRQPDTWCPMTTALHADRIGPTDPNEEVNRNTIAALLLRAGADPNGSPQDTTNPLHLAIGRDRNQIATLLIDAGASVQGRTPKDGPLPVALKRGNHVMVQRLVAAGAMLDPDPELLEEIAKAADAESLQVALGLMHKSLHSSDLTNALGTATFEDCAECVRLLFAAGARYSTDDWFALIGGTSAAVLDVYAAHGLKPRAVDENHSTLLHQAAAAGKADSVKWCLAHGVPVDAKEKESLRTPLMVAAEAGNVAGVKALLDAGANPALHDAWGKTPKVLAAQAYQRTPAHDEVVHLLRARGALEYTGAKLPPSKYDAEVATKEHNDVTGGFYAQLPFLKPGLRFFVVSPPPQHSVDDHGRQIMPDMAPPPIGALYAVFPDQHVLKLTRPDDVRALGFRLRSKDDALRLVRVYTDPHYAHQSWVNAQFDTPGFWEKDERDTCSRLTGWNIPRNSVVVAGARGGAVEYVVTRYVIPPDSLKSMDTEVKLEEMIKTTERVQADGGYSLEMNKIRTPGLVLHHDCSIL